MRSEAFECRARAKPHRVVTPDRLQPSHDRVHHPKSFVFLYVLHLFALRICGTLAFC